jgi:hypothetical protein
MIYAALEGKVLTKYSDMKKVTHIERTDKKWKSFH